ncbi:hypothetical protein BJX65DRAFT_280401 [Aspergillus insuetus]
MPAEGRKKLKPYDYTVGIICCLTVERTALKFMLDEEHDRPSKLPGDKSIYTAGTIHGHNVVIASLPLGYTGTTPVATVAQCMEHSFPSLKLRLLVGIGGGVPSDEVDIRLGDVVVSAPKNTYGGVVQYDFGREKPDGLERKGFLCPPPSEWLQVLAEIMSDQDIYHAQGRNRITETISALTKISGFEQYNRPKVDVLFEANSHHVKGVKTCDKCDKIYIVPRPTRKKPDNPVIHCGLIASGNRVMEHGLERDRISKELGGVICFEMEAAGLMNEFRCIVIRGISDYADSHKQDIWQPYAAAVAAGFAKEMLSYFEPPAYDINDASYWDIAQWLSQSNSLQRQQDILDERTEGTGHWFLESTEFHDWTSGDKGNLWCYGIPGSGKTVLAATAMHHLGQYMVDETLTVAGTFCDYQERHQQTPSEIFASFVKQLIIHQEEHHLHLSKEVMELYVKHHRRQTRPKFREYQSVLESELRRYRRVFLIIDAVDELPTNEETTARFLDALTSLGTNINIMFTSRIFTPLPCLEGGSLVEVRADDNDVRTYLKLRMERIPQLRRLTQGKEDVRKDIVETLTKDCNGMFLLARLQLDIIAEKDSLMQVKKALNELPGSLHEVYEGNMQRIEKQSDGGQLAHRVLNWTCYAGRPLTEQELQHALSVEIESRLLHEDDLVHRDFASLCCGLISVDERGRSVRFVHRTAQEYIQSSTKPRVYEVQKYLAETCLAYLQLSAFSDGPCETTARLHSRFRDHPFYSYAVNYWGTHVCGREKDTCCLVRKVLLSKQNLASAAQAMGIPLPRQQDSRTKLLQSADLALWVVAHFALEGTIKWLLAQREASVNSQAVDGNTALHIAANKGHPSVVEVLLKKGANRAITNGNQRTPFEEAELGYRTATLSLSKDSAVFQTSLQSICSIISLDWQWRRQTSYFSNANDHIRMGSLVIMIIACILSYAINSYLPVMACMLEHSHWLADFSQHYARHLNTRALRPPFPEMEDKQDWEYITARYDHVMRLLTSPRSLRHWRWRGLLLICGIALISVTRHCLNYTDRPTELFNEIRTPLPADPHLLPLFIMALILPLATYNEPRARDIIWISAARLFLSLSMVLLGGFSLWCDNIGGWNDPVFTPTVTYISILLVSIMLVAVSLLATVKYG